MDVSVFTEYEVQVSEITFKLRCDVLYDIYSCTITVRICNNPHIKFPKHLDEEEGERDGWGVWVNEVVRERHSVRTYITGKQETLWRYMILGTVLLSV